MGCWHIGFYSLKEIKDLQVMASVTKGNNIVIIFKYPKWNHNPKL